jgi:hypothetical protein
VRDRAVRAAVAVARAHGVQVTEPAVVRDLSNVLVELAPAPLLARVATSTAAARPDGAREWLARDVAVAAFLAREGAPVVPPASELPPGPHVHDGLAVTFWRLVRPAAPASPHEAGAELAVLHPLLARFSGPLPPLSAVLDEAETLIEWVGLPAPLVDALTRARGEIDAAGLPGQPLHGDAHAGNLLRTADGLLWTDFEDTCAGPVEWDLACLVTAGGSGDDALSGYGYRGGAAALAPFVEARLLQVAAWTAFMAEEHPHLRERAQERLSRWL